MDVVWEGRCSCEKYLSKIVLLQGAGLPFSQTFQLHIVRSEKLLVRSCCQPCTAALPCASLCFPGPSSRAAHVGFVWLSSEKRGKKNNRAHLACTANIGETLEMSWTQLGIWSRKWICRSSTLQTQLSRRASRQEGFPLCISWGLGSVFSLPTSVQFITKFKPLRVKLCNPCVIFKNCFKIRS